MGLLRYRRFSSIPTLRKKIQSRREQKEKHTPTFAEWGALNGERIVRNRTGAGAGTLYTVPKGRVLFITNVHVCIASNATPNGRGIISIGTTDGSGQGETLLNVTTDNTADSKAVSSTFNHLVKVIAGEIIEGKEISTNSSSIGFIGFELPESLEIV